MTRKKRRSLIILLGLATLGVTVGLVLMALKTQVTFFLSPTDIAQQHPAQGQRFRLGGLVEAGTYKKHEDAVSTFTITDGASTIAVSYKGILPDLFREGQGVVAEGQIEAGGVFIADTVLAKHDEKYMPPEVANALKKSGRWKDGQTSNSTPSNLSGS